MSRSPITPSLREDDAYRPPSSLATMDQYLSRDGDLLLRDSTDSTTDPSGHAADTSSVC